MRHDFLPHAGAGSTSQSRARFQTLKGNCQKMSRIWCVEMFEEAANAVEEIEPEEKTRTDVLGAQVNLYILGAPP